MRLKKANRGHFDNSGGFVSVPALVGLVAAASILTLLSDNLAQQSRGLAALELVTVESIGAMVAASTILAAIEDPTNDLEIGVAASNSGILISPLGEAYRVQVEFEGSKLNPVGAPPRIFSRYLQSLSPAFSRDFIPDADSYDSALVYVFIGLGGTVSLRQLETDLTPYRTARVDLSMASPRVVSTFEGRNSVFAGFEEITSVAPGPPPLDPPYTLVVTKPDAPERVLTQVRYRMKPDSRLEILQGFYASPLGD